MISITDGSVTLHRFQVVATVSPSGEVVALQIDNGDEFLSLTDLTDYGLARGIRYLATQSPRRPREYQALAADLPWARPVGGAGGIMAKIRGIFH